MSCRRNKSPMGTRAAGFRAAKLPILWLGSEFIAQSLNGENKFRLFRILFEFLAQAGHMHVHRAGVHVGAVSPYLFEQFFAGKCRAAVLDEIAKQLEFAGRS